MNKLDRYIFMRLFLITSFVMLMLVCTYIIFDYSNISDDLSDREITFIQALKDYYIHFVPEIMRLVSPLALLIACIYLTGQMTERLEIVALKAAGVSINRIVLPYLLFAILLASLISYMDAFINPGSNARTIAFEEQHLPGRSMAIDRGALFRFDSEDTIFNINYFNLDEQYAFSPRLVETDNGDILKIVTANRITWIDSLQAWQFRSLVERTFTDSGYVEMAADEMIYDMNILPGDLSRGTSDIFQLTWTEALDYISSIRRIGAGDINTPMVQLYGRFFYPLSILVVCLIGFSIAAVRRKGGRGFYIAAGFGFSFIYLAFMKIIEPFGSSGQIDPITAAAIPHVTFLFMGIMLLVTTRK